MSRSRFLAGVLGLVPFLTPVMAERVAAAAPPAATKPAIDTRFLRLVDQGAAGGKLEAAIVTYENQDKVRVALVSAIHIGERSYFEGLAKTFEKYDALLYELVKPRDADAPQKGAVSDNPIGKLQRFMKDVLNLEFQLDCIDYARPNFIHADLDAETFAKLQKDRGETFPQLMLKALMDAMTKPKEGAAAGKDPKQMLKEFIGTLTRPDGERQIKLMLARQMQDLEASAAGFNGPDGTSVIVHERNKKAIEILKKTIADGKKNIGIFYGAAHMPDMEQRLAQLGFKPIDAEYRTAWDLTIRADQPSTIEKLLNQALDLLE